MITSLKANFSNHTFIEQDSAEMYIVDYKSINGGGVEISANNPGVSHVLILNENQVPIHFHGFPDNAFEVSPGLHSRQCECILFPQTCDPQDWILAVETKYAFDLENAFRKENDYPNCIIDQVIDTVSYLRNKGIISADRRVNAIASFPHLIGDFSAYFLTGDRSLEDILIKHKIKIRPTNVAVIKSNRRIKI